MNAELLTVGTEILMGQILNSNARYISQKLTELGVNMYRQVTVGDNHDRLKQAIEEALERADVLIMTGGLGPTGDDISKETAAEVMQCGEMVMDKASWDFIVLRFSQLHVELTPNNRKQAMFPKESIILKNPNGTAPGCIMEKNGKAVILLPGPPKEMVPMFHDYVMPYLAKKSDVQLYSRNVRVFGSGESTVEYTLKDIMDMENPTIAPYAQMGEMMLRVTARCHSQQEGEALVLPVVERIQRTLGDVVYSTTGRAMHETVADMLLSKKLTLATAESCTGGMLASMLIDVPGSSGFLLEGDVTYCDAAKRRMLGVPQQTLDEFSAVSEQTARAMAEGVRVASGADIGVSTTGYAGPSGGTAEHPVGTVFVALADAEGTVVKKLDLHGPRERVRHMACMHTLDMIRRRYMVK